MKLGKSALLEIVAIVQDGIIEGRDISEQLRELELVPTSGEVPSPGDLLELSVAYTTRYPRASDWEETN